MHDWLTATVIGLVRTCTFPRLMQEWAPQMLFNPLGEPHLSWIVIMSAAKQRCRLGLSDAQYHAFGREWPASEEGRRLLEGLRWARGGG